MYVHIIMYIYTYIYLYMYIFVCILFKRAGEIWGPLELVSMNSNSVWCINGRINHYSNFCGFFAKRLKLRLNAVLRGENPRHSIAIEVVGYWDLWRWLVWYGILGECWYIRNNLTGEMCYVLLQHFRLMKHDSPGWLAVAWDYIRIHQVQ